MEKEKNESSFNFAQDPLLSFTQEFAKASLVVTKDVNAMSLATVSSDGMPSVRTVLYKGLHENSGLKFFTNYSSDKAKELAANPQAGALFFWPQLDQQIRFAGRVEKLPRRESEVYFASRPRLSQLGAWASQQSHELASYQALADGLAQVEEKFKGQEVPCPPNWGGYSLRPLEIEFWFGQTGRLHQRYCFRRLSVTQDHWQKFMKYP